MKLLLCLLLPLSAFPAEPEVHVLPATSWPGKSPTGLVEGFIWDLHDSKPAFSEIAVIPVASSKPYKLYAEKNGVFEFLKDIKPGEVVTFPPGEVRKIKVTGVDPESSICLTDKFRLQSKFAPAGIVSMSKTAITSATSFPVCEKRLAAARSSEPDRRIPPAGMLIPSESSIPPGYELFSEQFDSRSYSLYLKKWAGKMPKQRELVADLLIAEKPRLPTDSFSALASRESGAAKKDFSANGSAGMVFTKQLPGGKKATQLLLDDGQLTLQISYSPEGAERDLSDEALIQIARSLVRSK